MSGMRVLMTAGVAAMAAVMAAAMPYAPALAAKAKPAKTTQVETIAAVVNDDAVSASDVSARLKLIMTSSGMPDEPEIREKMTPQIINSLIDERLMMQEARRLGVTVLPEDIQQGFGSIAEQNAMTPEQFQEILYRSGIAMKTLTDQIEAQLAWSRVIQVRLRPQVDITDGQVDAALQRLEADQGKAQYLVAEIFLPVQAGAPEADARDLAGKLIQQMKEARVPFQRVAMQFSQAAGAAAGGDLGWVREGQMPQEVEDALARMQPGELSPPVRSSMGYHILLLREKSVQSAENMPERDDMRRKLGVEQLERLQRRLLLDLKSAAFIERRA